MSCEKTNGNEKGLIIKYPITKKDNVYDSYFDIKIEDPYRWLENDRSPETEKWVIEQNKITNNYLSLIPYRDSLILLVNLMSLVSPLQCFGDFIYQFSESSGSLTGIQ